MINDAKVAHNLSLQRIDIYWWRCSELVCSFEPFEPQSLFHWRIETSMNVNFEKQYAKTLWLLPKKIQYFTSKSQLNLNSTRHCSVSLVEQWIVYFCHSIVYWLLLFNDKDNDRWASFEKLASELLGWCGKLTVKFCIFVIYETLIEYHRKLFANKENRMQSIEIHFLPKITKK